MATRSSLLGKKMPDKVPRRYGVKLITEDYIKTAKPGTILARGIARDEMGGLDIAGTGNEVRWVAVKGGVDDWCIYTQNPHYGDCTWTYEEVARMGDKIHSSSNIKFLVDLKTEEVLQMYRH